MYISNKTMESSIPLLSIFFFVSLYFLINKLCFPIQRKLKLPPGPKPWPILGNIFHLTNKPHHALAALSSIHGPLMTLHLGSVRTVVISSSDVAKDAFSNHDLALSSRHAPDATLALNHRHHSMAWLPVAHQWRNLRKLVAIQLFSTKRLDSSENLRRTKVLELVDYVGQCCKNREAVDIGKAAFTTSLNLLSNTFFSADLAGYGTTSSQEYRDAVWGMMECVRKPNLADFFPLLSYFDPNGIRRELAGHFGKLFELFDVMIERRMTSADRGDSSGEDDVLEKLLRISDVSVEDIKHMLLDLISAGTDTTSSTIEWAMTELLRDPSKMAKAQSELNEILETETLIRDSDIERLPYLRAIVKETLRLHPPAPLLVPHKANDDVDLQGYVIPKNTQVLVNVWAIGQDSATWKNPSEFQPERFLFLEKADVDVKGRDFELIPFGAGRRICPGLPLAYRVIHVMLGALIHGFGWKLPNGMRVEEVDMDDRFGLTLQKATPLLALPLSK